MYFITKGIAEAYVKITVKGDHEVDGETEDKVKGIVSVGKIFGYSR